MNLDTLDGPSPDQSCIAPGNWPYLTTDGVVWLPSEGRWIGRTSPKLTKEVREAAAKARGPGASPEMTWPSDPSAPMQAPSEASFDDLL